MQTIVAFGLRFQRGKWRCWEHTCSAEEIEGVVDSAMARAADHGRPGQPTYVDHLEGARYIFDVAYGPREEPVEGDTWVYGVRIDRIVIGNYEELKHHFAKS
jgi:hypothetical protein